MDKSSYKIHIIGAGISGLIAAKVLENHGYQPTIIEATDQPGGRVKTDIIDGYTLDHGFQVLLTSYPAAQKHLDFEALDLQYFLPGAVIFNQGKQKTIGDPVRNTSLLFPTLISNVGYLSDKLKVLRLNSMLKKKTIVQIFSEKEMKTISFLEVFGFSKSIIEQFFRPFFSGIFLEPNLETSSRMFQFIYKMFGSGFAAIPKSGIAAIPNQLVSKLENTNFRYQTTVKSVYDGKIILENGENIESHFTIVATEPNAIIPNLKEQETSWKSCDTFYFETNTRVIEKPLIGLISDSDSIINNIVYPTCWKTAKKSKKELLSVTVVKQHHLDEVEIVKRIESELKLHCDIQVHRFIKRYNIQKALPNLTNLRYEIPATETKLTNSIFLAGDHQINGSLNAAMISGEKAALGIINTLENGPIVGELTSEFN